MFFSTEEVLVCLSEAGFGVFETRQNIFPDNNTQQIENDYGAGSFVVIKGINVNMSE